MILVIACPFRPFALCFIPEAIDWAGGGVAAAPKMIRSSDFIGR